MRVEMDAMVVFREGKRGDGRWNEQSRWEKSSPLLSWSPRRVLPATGTSAEMPNRRRAAVARNELSVHVS